MLLIKKPVIKKKNGTPVIFMNFKVFPKSVPYETCRISTNNDAINLMASKPSYLDLFNPFMKLTPQILTI